MKKIIATLFLAIINGANAQVIIGGPTGSTNINTSVLLDFATGQNKGIILPYVRTIPTAPTEGTILLDASTPLTSRVKYYAGAVKGWVDLSGQNANLNSSTVLANFATEQPASITELANSKAIIGATSSSADGVLVLESTTKAMILPIVADVQNILSPSPGMMVYVNKAGAKRLAVYNGAKWSFWKP
ncbi:hypothetical protein [Frigoriflavimonas asaccharolytica]|uniref:Uncharacterized protein n=1 Tax=Frigoriflavimonas asaccharolytica TaxID=2735899 RepID=A0A8J8K8Q2_9FLAO|nr:hypothetical protein [Frigoriflavimonas asaccharolytica]NRS93168.1 hypothetical protein [Frigoriflavimonas asaccharolytica]